MYMEYDLDVSLLNAVGSLETLADDEINILSEDEIQDIYREFHDANTE